MVISPADAFIEVVVALQTLVSRIEWFIGGFFGLYLLYYLFSYVNQRKGRKLLEEIRDELRELNNHKQLPKTKEKD